MIVGRHGLEKEKDEDNEGRSITKDGDVYYEDCNKKYNGIKKRWIDLVDL